MAYFHETFSDRQKARATTETPQTYIYTELPSRLRGQIIYILRDALGIGEQSYSVWHRIELAYKRTQGRDLLVVPSKVKDTILGSFATQSVGSVDSPPANVQSFIRTAEVEEALDVIELCFLTLHQSGLEDLSKGQRSYRNIELTVDEAVEQLNDAFRRNSVGYSFAGGELIRVSDFVMHNEVVEPALRLLSAKGFDGPLDEYMRAHRHFRHGEHQDAVIDANNAFESTLKTALARLGEVLTGDERPEQLIRLATSRFLPKQVQSHLTALSAVMQGLPTLRSKTPGIGHGQGQSPSEVLDSTAEYALHLAGANIIFAIESYERLEPNAVST